MKTISIATFPFQRKHGDKKALEIAHGFGAKVIDFDLTLQTKANKDSIYSKSDEEITSYYTELKELAQSYGITFGQTHGRITGFKNIKDYDDTLIDDARIDCMVTSILGAPICVIHSVTTIFLGPDADPKLMHELNFDMFTRILEHAKTYNVKIASETFGDATGYNCCDFFGNITEFLKSYNRIKAVGNNKDYLGVCVDTGHSNKAMRFNNPTPGDVIRMLGDNIICLHLNDNDTFTDQHKIPMSGCIDWNDVFSALDEVGYNGIYNMELALNTYGADFAPKEAEFALSVMENILTKRYGDK